MTIIGVCIFWKIQLSDWLAITNILLTIISITVAIHIYNKWKTQKQIERISDISSLLLKEVINIKNEIISINSTFSINDEVNLDVKEILGKKRDFIEFELNSICSCLNLINTKNHQYDSELMLLKQVKDKYILNFTDFIRSLDKGIQNKTLLELCENSNKLAKILSDIKFYNL